ncbi:hypothetical protein [Neorhizobium sp. NCHU2750]|uniref:hypothetical protein n=1 Tax=Neorhizobium sp. NCHU2750 TaxID=1825976 RepID=UPI000E715B2C|nr:hypothetical protein NCHU2750_19180 [Neorhizobium sp. NCHU2750]
MKDVIFETGTIVEVGESRSYGGTRFYTHIELQRADGSKARLDDVAVSLIVTPKLLTKAVELNLADAPVATIAFVNQKGQMLDKPLIMGGQSNGRFFRNLVLGYASENGYGIERGVSKPLLLFSKIATVVLAFLCLYILVAGWWLIALILPVLGLLIAAVSWRQLAGFQKTFGVIQSKFIELGYIDRTTTVYS